MIRAKVTVDKRSLDKLLELPDEAMKETYDYFKDKTPIRTGNAKRNTRKQHEAIAVTYDYFNQLDAGKSSQAPKGMTDPSTKEFIKTLERLIQQLK